MGTDDVQELLALLAITNSLVFTSLVSLQLARTELAQSYEVGLIQQTPVPEIPPADGRALAALARRAWSLKRSLDTRHDTSHAFTLPALLQTGGASLSARAAAWAARVAETDAELAGIQAEIDDRCFALYGIDDEDRRRIEQGFGPAAGDAEEAGPAEDDDDTGEEETPSAANAPRLVAELLAWAVGVAAGRFDLRLATGDRAVPPEPEPFDPLPVYSPGMLPNGEVPEGYPLTIDEDGILVEDEGHPDDLLGKVREVQALVWPENHDEIEAEAAEILGVPTLRDWFRSAGGGFWDDHLKRYSKSRRKAPIYWMLSVPSRQYAVWLYCHRFSRDTLYKVLNDYVTPKLAHEQRRLESLRAEHGPDPAAAGRKVIEAQESFVDELRAFRDEVARVAPLWNPDLNDGVILNFAPLWRLVPQHPAWQKECRECWDKLVKGDYDWAHLAMHLWPERVVPKCADDRSLAIAHGLEDAFWREESDGKWQPRAVSHERVGELVAERTSPAVKAALQSLLEAPEAAKRGRGRRQ